MTESEWQAALETMRDTECSWSDRLCAALEQMLHLSGNDDVFAEIRDLVAEYNAGGLDDNQRSYGPRS